MLSYLAQAGAMQADPRGTEKAEGQGEGGQAADKIVNLPAGAVPINASSAIRNFRGQGVGGMVLGCPVDLAGCKCGEKAIDHFPAQRGQTIMELSGGFLRADVDGFFENDIAGIHAFIHVHDADACFAIAIDDSPVNGGGSAIFRQQRGVDIEAAEARQLENISAQNFSIGSYDKEISLHGGELSKSLGTGQFLRLDHGNALAAGELLHRRSDQVQPASLRLVRLGDDGDNLTILALAQGCQGGNGKIGGAEKNDPVGLHRKTTDGE